MKLPFLLGLKDMETSQMFKIAASQISSGLSWADYLSMASIFITHKLCHVVYWVVGSFLILMMQLGSHIITSERILMDLQY